MKACCLSQGGVRYSRVWCFNFGHNRKTESKHWHRSYFFVCSDLIAGNAICAHNLLISGDHANAVKFCETILLIELDRSLTVAESNEVFHKLSNLVSILSNASCYDSSLAIAKKIVNLHENLRYPECKAERLRACSRLLVSLVNKLVNAQRSEDARQRVLPVLERILRIVKNDFRDEMSMRALYEASCLADVGYCSNKVNDYARAIEANEESVSLMKATLQSHLNKYYVVGCSYLNLGTAYGNLQRFDEAKEYFAKALDVFKTANDWTQSDQQDALTNKAKQQQTYFERLSLSWQLTFCALLTFVRNVAVNLLPSATRQ